MTTAQFFEKFDLFAGAPDAVAKMRSLILELAVRGQLTSVTSHPSASSDPSAATLPLNHSRYTSGWRVVLLADVLKNRSGNSKLIKGKLHDTPAPHLYQGFSASGADVWCDDFEHEGQAIIVSAVGARCGKAFKAAGKWSAIANTNIVRPDPEHFDFDFAYLVLNDEAFWVRGGSAQPFVKFPPSFDRYFALPPLTEQKRIVAKVDELMALCDQLEAQQQERETKHTALAQATLARFAEAPTPTNLNLLFHSSFSIQPSDLRKTILKLAMHGRLGARKQIKTVRLDSLGSWAQGCGFPVAEQGHKDRPILFSKVSDMNLPGNEREIKTTNNTIDDKTAKRLRIKVHPKGAVIFPKIGGAIATNKRRILTRPTAIDNNCSGIIPNETCSTEWLYLVLSGIDFAQYQTGTSVPAVNQGALGEIPVALPPLAEQKRIVAKVEELMALVDALEAQQAAATQAATHLLDAVVSELAAAA